MDEEKKGVTRRNAVVGLACVAGSLGLGALATCLPADDVLRPPGGQDDARLLSLCVRCQRCFEACPRKARSPASIEDGFLNLRTPRMDFHSGWCDFCEEENDGHPRCVLTCPTGALRLDEGAKRRDVVIGKPLLTHDWCLAYRRTRCRDCYDACELDAITLDDAKRPHLDLDKCNGCGACEYVCPSMRAGSMVSGTAHRAIIIVNVDESGEA